MTVGEYGRIAWTAIVVLMSIMFVLFLIRLVTSLALDGVDVPSGIANIVFAGAIIAFVSWGAVLSIRELRVLNARWGDGPGFPLIVLCVSGALVALFTYGLIEGSWKGQVLECVNGACRSYTEWETEDAIMTLAPYVFLVAVFAASAWWLGTRRRDQRVTA